MSQATVEAPEVKKFRREIQPMRDGKPVGKAHVYEAATEQELMDKMATAIENGTLKINELSQKIKPEAPADADLEEDIAEFKGRDLTTDEKFELANQLRDPNTVDVAFDRLYEARFGRKPSEVAKAQNQAADNNKALRTRLEADAFMRQTPEYCDCLENGQAIAQWCYERKMALTAKNFRTAYLALNDDGLLITQDDKKTKDVNAEPDAEVRTEPKPEVKREVRTAPASSGLSRQNSTSTQPPKAPGKSAADIAKMGPQEFKAWAAKHMPGK